jgi:hypothetical protein
MPTRHRDGRGGWDGGDAARGADRPGARRRPAVPCRVALGADRGTGSPCRCRVRRGSADAHAEPPADARRDRLAASCIWRLHNGVIFTTIRALAYALNQPDHEFHTKIMPGRSGLDTCSCGKRSCTYCGGTAVLPFGRRRQVRPPPRGTPGRPASPASSSGSRRAPEAPRPRARWSPVVGRPYKQKRDPAPRPRCRLLAAVRPVAPPGRTGTSPRTARAPGGARCGPHGTAHGSAGARRRRTSSPADRTSGTPRDGPGR